MTRALPNFRFERQLWKREFIVVAGVDEVGRGCFAGPVVAGCVVFPANFQLPIYNLQIKINDSKKLSPKQREIAAIWIKENALTWGVGSAPASLINRIGIIKATEVAFRKAIVNCKSKIDYLLIDAFYIPYVRGLRRKNQKPIVNGDQKSFSIAAASIIAKVYRDKYMVQLSELPKYKKYRWGSNKGYGTKEHQQAIMKSGVTRYHRNQFVGTFLAKSQNSNVKSQSYNAKRKSF